MAELSDEVIDFLQRAPAPRCWATPRPTADRWQLRCGLSSTTASWCSTPARESAKGRALGRDSRVVICVDDPHPPYSFVQVQGTASVQDGAEDLLEIATRIGGRYMGAHRAKEFGQRNAVSGELVVRVQPTKVNSAFNIAD